MCIFCAWALWKRSLPMCSHKCLFWQRWCVESFATAQHFFQGLVWCQRTAEGSSTQLLAAFTFIAVFLQWCLFLLVELIRFSKVSQACCNRGWHRRVARWQWFHRNVHFFVPFHFRNSWNSLLLKDKPKQTTSPPLEGWGLKRKLLTVDYAIAFVVQHTLKSVIQDSYLLRPVDSPSLGD